jgi:hypothetical protein
MAFLMQELHGSHDIEYPPGWEGYTNHFQYKDFTRSGLGIPWRMDKPGSGLVLTCGGFPVDVTSGPKWLRLRRSRPITQFFSCSYGFLISETAKGFIESLEPGLHQFLPVEVLAPNRARIATHYYLNICQRLDAIDPVASGAKPYTYPDGQLRRYDIRNTHDLVLRSETIQGKHLWFDMYFDSGSHPFVSAAFAEGFKRLKLNRRISFLELKEI